MNSSCIQQLEVWGFRDCKAHCPLQMQRTHEHKCSGTHGDADTGMTFEPADNQQQEQTCMMSNKESRVYVNSLRSKSTSKVSRGCLIRRKTSTWDSISGPPAHGSLRLPGPDRLRGVNAGVGTGAPPSGPPLDMVCPAALSATPAAAGKASCAETWWTPVTYTMHDNNAL